MNEDQIKQMVGRFLNWRLPKDFSPDAGISFKAAYNENTPHQMEHKPTGTKLLDATQADAMVRHITEGLPSTGARAVITGSRIEISIDIDALPGIVSGSCCADGLDGLWKVTEPAIFAKEVCHALNDEREDGTTPVHMMFDKAFMAAIEQGAEGIEEVDDEAFETEAARLQEEARRSR